MMTLSVVSHGQGALVQTLMDDLERLHSPLIEKIIITINIPESWRPVTHHHKEKLVFLENSQPQGFGANHNAAFQLCTSPCFAVLNPDLRLPEEVFGPLGAALANEATLGMIAPRIVGPNGVLQDAVRPLITPWQLLLRRLGRRPAQARADWLAGMFMLFRSDAFRQLQGFDPRYFMYCEDFDICARLRLAGWHFRCVDSMTVVHDARRASLKSSRHLYWHLSSLLKMWLSAAFWRYRRLLRRSRQP